MDKKKRLIWLYVVIYYHHSCLIVMILLFEIEKNDCNNNNDSIIDTVSRMMKGREGGVSALFDNTASFGKKRCSNSAIPRLPMMIFLKSQ